MSGKLKEEGGRGEKHRCIYIYSLKADAPLTKGNCFLRGIVCEEYRAAFEMCLIH